ncbi:MAG: aconitase X catalytic domain-containing protein [Gammaproteobacteria bacterium]|nr:aconitase X catalytic domain-containing protein [Gammaproteobacteria bacterium]
MNLTTEEQAMLRGDRGPAVKDALEYLIKVGEFWGAERLVEVTNVHMMGDIEVMGDGGLKWLECTADKRASCAVNVSTNARSFDFPLVAQLHQDPAEATKERALIGHLQKMNVTTTDTCINYQTLYQPHLGERVAWGDTGTVIYANSVFGARSNFESGPAAFAAGLTGRVPEYGFHLDRHRKGTFVVQVDADLDDLADWGAVSKLVGEPNQSYYQVPVFTGMKRKPSSDELKHLGAGLASYGSMGMFHMVGVTPEAPTLEAALGGNTPHTTMTITNADLEKVYGGYDLKDGRCDLIVFSGPQLSLWELKDLSAHFKGKKVCEGTQVFVTSSNGVHSAARKEGFVQTLEAAGVTIMEGVCFYILQNLSQMRQRNGWTNMISNSAKIVNIIGAHRFNTILRRTAECVEIATTGSLR